MHATTLNDRAKGYERMASGFRCLGEVWDESLDLQACTTGMSLSLDEFQHQFSRWTGTDLQQFQTVPDHSLPDVFAGTRRTAPASPLHGVSITDEGRMPDGAKSGEQHLKLVLGRAQTPFGVGIFLISPRGLCGLGFADRHPKQKTGFEHPGYDATKILADFGKYYPGSDHIRDDREAERWAMRIFDTRETVEIALYGTVFQRDVWRAMLKIPVGQTTTYGALAAIVGKPGAARATGAAVAANPVAWLVPCHRVLSSSRRLHNYHWGVARKRAMLVYEKVHAAA